MDLLLSGDYHEIIQLPFDEDRVSSGIKAYLVPDQIDLASITGVCEWQKETSWFIWSTSSSISQTCSNQGKTQKQNYTVQE